MGELNARGAVVGLGIDPGLSGGVVAVQGGEVLLSEPMPVVGTKRRTLDLRGLRALFLDVLDAGPVVAALEHQQPFPRDGRVGSFKCGRGFGSLEAMLVALDVRFVVVRPTAWQRAVCTGVEGDTKLRSILTAQRRLPGLDLTPGRKRKPHDGLADAACLALYAVQLHAEGRL
jgi:crossover junction endodeoxyribonuclease RuvC